MLQPVIELEFDYDDIDINIALTICMKFFFLQLSLILKLISFCLSAFGIEKMIMVFFSLSQESGHSIRKKKCSNTFSAIKRIEILLSFLNKTEAMDN